jgi:hypothetical protein
MKKIHLFDEKRIKLNSTFHFFRFIWHSRRFSNIFFFISIFIFNKYQILFWKNIKIEKYKIKIFFFLIKKNLILNLINFNLFVLKFTISIFKIRSILYLKNIWKKYFSLSNFYFQKYISHIKKSNENFDNILFIIISKILTHIYIY